MARVDYDETWEKLLDGRMRLIERVERLVSDEEIEKQTMPRHLEAFAKRPVASLTRAEKDELLELLLKNAAPPK